MTSYLSRRGGNPLWLRHWLQFEIGVVKDYLERTSHNQFMDQAKSPAYWSWIIPLNYSKMRHGSRCKLRLQSN